jgi:integrase
MASIARRPNGQWRARYQAPDGKWHARHFARKIDAQKWLDEQTAGIVTGTYVDPRAGKVTFTEYAETWRKAQVHRPSTQVLVEATLRRNAFPALGARPLAAILPSDIQAWVKRLSTGGPDRQALTPATVAVVHGIVSGIFRAAIRDRKIVANPCESTRLPNVTPKRIEPLTTEAVRSLEASAPPRWRAFITALAGTGLRQGELLGLTVDRIDFLRRVLRVDRQLSQVPGQTLTLTPPKTAASVRTMPLPPVVVAALAAHLAEFPPGPEGFVFTDDNGAPMRRRRFSRAVWIPMRTAAGLLASVSCHDLRHYYASLLIRHGESVKTVQARLGHASASETLDTYSHLWPDSDDRTREAVDAVLGTPRDSGGTAKGGDA